MKIKFKGIELENDTFTRKDYDDYFELYDLKGNEIYCEYNDDYWIKRRYDLNGNEIYYEDSDGYWFKREYNSNGNEIYSEDSYGCWCEIEYDNDGNKIYYKDNDGVSFVFRKNKENGIQSIFDMEEMQ